MSRRHLLLEPLGSDQVRVTNQTHKQSSTFTESSSGVLDGGCSVVLGCGGRIDLIDCVIGFQKTEVGTGFLDAKTGGSRLLAELSAPLFDFPPLSDIQETQLIGWLQKALEVLQSTAGSANFLDRAAEALVAIVGLDQGQVLLWKDDQWTTIAQHGQGTETSPSGRVLTELVRWKRTYWKTERHADDTPSLTYSEMIIASPILNADSELVGALYGERRKLPSPTTRVPGRVEALIVEVIASGVATGLDRKAAMETEIRFEEFFGPHLARHFVQHPDKLAPRETEVTLLFCDVRGFSKYSEKLGPAGTLEWMNDVMSVLSESVLREKGVLVDYVGDELFAMWGVPDDQPDQAERAVRAALNMLDSLADINSRWRDHLGENTEIGIGINTGLAQVGNTGSKFKFKYGALGNSVNLASRVQGLTKFLKRPLLVTRATREKLDQGFIARRICTTRVVNIETPVDLYEVARSGTEGRRVFFQDSEDALDTLDIQRNFPHAARKAGTLLLDSPEDGPLRLTLSRASAALMDDGESFDPIWCPPGK